MVRDDQAEGRYAPPPTASPGTTRLSSAITNEIAHARGGWEYDWSSPPPETLRGWYTSARWSRRRDLANARLRLDQEVERDPQHPLVLPKQQDRRREAVEEVLARDGPDLPRREEPCDGHIAERAVHRSHVVVRLL